jgi:hypothetical protein
MLTYADAVLFTDAGCCERELQPVERNYTEQGPAGTQFTCFTSTTVHILTQKLEELETLRAEVLDLLALLVLKYRN